MGILENLQNLEVTRGCYCDIIEEIINEISRSNVSKKAAGMSKYIEFLRDQADKIEDRDEREKAKTEVVKYEHRINPQIARPEKKVEKKIENEQ